MRPNVKQIIADKRRMKEYVAKRILLNETTRIELATGTWADLYPTRDDHFGWMLHWETNEPEWVDIRKIYDHFRGEEMTWTEWRNQIDGELARSKVRELEREMAVLRQESSSSASPADANGLSLAVGKIQLELAEIKAKLDGLDHLRELTVQEDDPSFTVKQVANKLQVSVTKVYQLTESGTLKSYKTGIQVRIKASHIREYQDRHTRHAENTKKRRRGSFNKTEADRIFGPGWDS